jgi:hypothetical protein
VGIDTSNSEAVTANEKYFVFGALYFDLLANHRRLMKVLKPERTSKHKAPSTKYALLP